MKTTRAMMKSQDAQHENVIASCACDRNYFAKSTMTGNEWRGPWSQRKTAEEAARKFVADWAECGVKATASVFYRDGSTVAHFSKELV